MFAQTHFKCAIFEMRLNPFLILSDNVVISYFMHKRNCRISCSDADAYNDELQHLMHRRARCVSCMGDSTPLSSHLLSTESTYR